MIDRLKTIKNTIDNNSYKSEISVIDGIIKPLLNELDWDIFDINEVKPEYSLSKKRVDIALCYKNTPFVFIEAKKIDAIDTKAEEQLLGYAFQEGVPMAILTDGKEWHFYLPALQGKFNERRFYKLDLTEREPKDSCDILNRYLKKELVINSNVIENARQDYKDSQKTKEISKKLPEAWQKLIDEKDDILIGLLTEKVSDLCGHNPDNKMVIDFLRKLTTPQKEYIVIPQSNIDKRQYISNQDGNGEMGVTYQNKFHAAKSGVEIMLILMRIVFKDYLNDIRDNDNKILNSKVRSFIANDHYRGLYRNPKNKNYGHREIVKGWYMCSNYSIADFKSKVDCIHKLTNIPIKDVVINWEK